MTCELRANYVQNNYYRRCGSGDDGGGGGGGGDGCVVGARVVVAVKASVQVSVHVEKKHPGVSSLMG